MERSSRSALLRFLAWLGGHELAILLAIGGIAAGVWVFAMIADEIMEGGPQAFDRKLLLAMRRPGDLAPIGPPAVQDAARDITALGGVVVVGLLTVVTSGFLALDGKRHMALFVFGSLVSGFIASTILKDLFVRPRPDLVPRSAYSSGASFPSGHSMMSAITYLTLGALLARSRERKRLKAYFFLVAALLTFMVGVSRVYLGVHWPLRTYWLVGLLAQCGRCSAGLLPGGFRVVARASGRQNTLTLLAELREAEIVHWPSIPHLPLDWDRLIAAHSARPPQSRAIFNELCRAVFGEVSSGEDI